MTSTLTRSSLSALFLLGNVIGQTYVVDAANGPGTDFTDLYQAVTTVPDGAVLLVRAGIYAPGSLTITRGLTVLAEPNVQVLMQFNVPLRIENLTAQQSVVWRAHTITALPFDTVVVQCTNCAGSVQLDDLGNALDRRRLSITNCSNVVARFTNWASLETSTVTNSNLVLEQCGISISAAPPIPPAFRQQGGSVQMTECIVQGGSLFATGAGNAIEMIGGELRLLGGTSVAAGDGFLATNARAIVGTGVVRVDPAVALSGTAPAIAASLTASTVAMPHVTRDSPTLGGTMHAQLHGPLGQLGFLLASLSPQPFVVPGIPDRIWLEPTSAVVLAAGVPAAGVPVTAALAVPAAPGLLGLQVVWQGITFDPTAGLQASNPTIYVVH